MNVAFNRRYAVFGDSLQRKLEKPEILFTVSSKLQQVSRFCYSSMQFWSLSTVCRSDISFIHLPLDDKI
jgi:hypothetical protein